MNFSTNQVMQLFVLGENEAAEVKKVIVPGGNPENFDDVKGFLIQVLNEEGEVIDVTDFIEKANILSITESAARDNVLYRKGLPVALSSEVNGGKPVKGEEYVMTLVYRGFGEEDTYSKVFSAKATDENPATLLKALAKNMLANLDVEYSPLYELYTGEGVKITMANYETAVTAEGFCIVEPVPYWSLGRFAETLMTIDVHTAPITLDGEDENAWLAYYKFMPLQGEIVEGLPNSKRIADLEYFCKGERGTSNALVGWPDTPDYVAKVNPKSANGYDILTIHYAYVGPNASNQKSEKDLIFVSEAGSNVEQGLNYIKTMITTGQTPN